MLSTVIICFITWQYRKEKLDACHCWGLRGKQFPASRGLSRREKNERKERDHERPLLAGKLTRSTSTYFSHFQVTKCKLAANTVCHNNEVCLKICSCSMLHFKSLCRALLYNVAQVRRLYLCFNMKIHYFLVSCLRKGIVLKYCFKTYLHRIQTVQIASKLHLQTGKEWS